MIFIHLIINHQKNLILFWKLLVFLYSNQSYHDDYNLCFKQSPTKTEPRIHISMRTFSYSFENNMDYFNIDCDQFFIFEMHSQQTLEEVFQ